MVAELDPKNDTAFFFFLLPDQCRKKQFKWIILHSNSKLENLKDSSAPGPIKYDAFFLKVTGPCYERYTLQKNVTDNYIKETWPGS